MVECQRVHSKSIRDTVLDADQILAAFGRLPFLLQEMTGHGVIELLVLVDNPRPVADSLMLLVGKAVATTMPSLHFVLAVPASNGGRCVAGDAFHNLEPNSKRELVILDGLTARLENQAVMDVPVG